MTSALDVNTSSAAATARSTVGRRPPSSRCSIDTSASVRSLSSVRTSSRAAANASLAGVYAPVYDERADHDLEVVGEIPDDLDGVYVRNGPNPRYSPPGRYHWFDGDGMIRAVRFRGGRASYRNRWIRTRGFAEE